MASEDIGLADPQALAITIAARDAFRFLGSPEGELALAQAVTYLSLAPKSNATYRAFGAAARAARDTPAEPVPLHVRNAPTQLMKDLGYGREYEYPHDAPDQFVARSNLPDSVGGEPFYEPTDQGEEAAIAERLSAWRKRRSETPA